IFSAYLSAGNVLNQAQLGLSAWHAGTSSVNAMLNQFSLGLEKVLGKGTIGEGLKDMATAVKAPFTDYIKGGELLEELDKPAFLDNPAFTGEVRDIARALMAGGGAARQDILYQTQMADKMKEAFRNGNVISGLLKAPFALLEGISGPIFEKLVPRLKLGAFWKLAEMELKRNPQLLEDGNREQLRTLMGKAWDSIDNRMGQVRYDNIFWNKVFKDLLMASVRSVGWTGGTIREIGGGLIDAGKAVNSLRKGEPLTPDMMTHRMAYTTSLVVMTGIMGAVTQFLLTGKGPDSSSTQAALTDLYYPKTGNLDEYGNPERISYPTYMKDIVSYGKHPFTTLTNKVHPLLSLISDMLNNKDFYGKKVYNEGDPLTRKAIDIAKHAGLAFEPFASRGIRRNIQLNEGRINEKTFWPFIGLTPAPANISKTPAQKAMDEERAGKAQAGGRSTQDQAKVDVKLQIERLMRKDPPAGQQLLKENLSKFSPREIQNIQMSKGIAPYTAAFKHLPVEDALRVYDLGTPKEKEEFRPLLGKKLMSLPQLSADRMAAVLAQLKSLGVVK
ncbi:MAG: hypothetical protein HQK99_16875, partial [Nitrospirae bacterium]|nr:hypothetical protein [Nitrospirota bacterium]